jgi:hypothetical protein
LRRRVAAVVTGSGLALAIAVCLPGSCGSGNRVDATAERGAAPAALSRPRAIPAPTGVVRPADAPPHPGAVLGGGRSTFPEESSVARALAAYSADELALFAEFERLTGRAAPAELGVLVERRRARADAEALIADARHLFAGDPLGRAAALAWLRAHEQH